MKIEISAEAALVLGTAAVKRAEEFERKAPEFNDGIRTDMLKLASELRLFATELFKVPV